MQILLWTIAILGGGAGIITSVGTIFYLFWTLGYKFYRKFRYGISLFN